MYLLKCLKGYNLHQITNKLGGLKCSAIYTLKKILDEAKEVNREDRKIENAVGKKVQIVEK